MVLGDKRLLDLVKDRRLSIVMFAKSARGLYGCWNGTYAKVCVYNLENSGDPKCRGCHYAQYEQR